MAQIPHVQPGEVIRSSVINGLIDQINALASGAPAPGVTVPDVFGRTLSQARTLITQPSVNLALGATLDAFGTAVDPNASSSATRLVIGQAPSAGARAPVGSPVNLVVTAQGSTTPPLPLPPSITRTETATGTAATSFRVGETLVIVGNNFSVTSSQNAVLFDGTPATSVTSDPSDSARRLLVVVPAGIPGGPVNPGNPDKPGVVLSVSTLGSAPATTTVTVRAPSGVPQPQIGSFNSSQFVGSDVTISGQNFSNVAARNIVRFGTVPAAAIVSAAPTQLVVRVPDFSDLPASSGSTKVVQISVTVNDASNNPIGTAVSSTNLTVVRP